MKNINIKSNEIEINDDNLESVREYKSKNDGNNKIFQNRPFSKTTQEFIRNATKNISIGSSGEFTGFFNKKFDLTLYKKNCENTRLKLKSPIRIYYPNHKRGNGIPTNTIERINFLGKKFNDQKFINYYNNKPVKKEYGKLLYFFDDTIEYIINYSKKNSQLDSLMMAYYFVCKEIKFDKECYEEDKETKYNQRPENVFEEGFAVSSGFTNLFELILKKMEIKYKHIDGYCKLMPKKVKKLKRNNKKSLSRTQSAKNINEELPQLSQTVNHSWNAVFIKGEWYFCDCLLGSGTLEKEEDIITKMNLKQLDINNNLYNFNNNNVTNESNTKSGEEIDTFNFFYFMVLPELFINTHRPIDDDWQFIDKIISFKQFYYKRLINYGDFYRNAYKYDVKLITHKSPYISITTKDSLKIKLKILDHVIEANLFNSAGTPKITEVKCIFHQLTKTYILEPTFPKKGEYILKINARAVKSTDLLYSPLIDYFIKVDTYFQIGSFNNFLTIKETINKKNHKVEELLPKLSRSSSTGILTPKIVSDYSKIFPPKSFKKICYDNEDFRLIEPRSNYLRKGANVNFKVCVKGAINVSILDGNHLTSLKRKEDWIFIGEKEIETNNVSLCCLRGKNVFTEIYKFKVLAERTILSSKPLLPRKRRIIFK